jgi:hypothetical protein
MTTTPNEPLEDPDVVPSGDPGVRPNEDPDVPGPDVSPVSETDPESDSGL